ncbi:Uncharacterised protein [Yersinia mollaretii]|uniref:hypothetical protein n=1 Tax=Yersinia mollaretii TaxID=33060 RepID=UPI0005DA9B48|nr:hypothetical protein [Yersinia mollaretii]CNJ96971.1 Uncharacterised protein [Yersinia mollaretii]
MEATDRTKVTLARIQLIADISQVAHCSTSEFLIVMALISDLAHQAITESQFQDRFYRDIEKEKH